MTSLSAFKWLPIFITTKLKFFRVIVQKKYITPIGNNNKKPVYLFYIRKNSWELKIYLILWVRKKQIFTIPLALIDSPNFTDFFYISGSSYTLGACRLYECYLHVKEIICNLPKGSYFSSMQFVIILQDETPYEFTYG